MENKENLKKKTIISTLSLFFQSGYSAVLGLIANLVLTIIVSPKVFGIYFTTLSIISILNYFSDIGLAASLIQKKDINDEDKKTAFTIQQILVLFLISIAFLSTNLIVNFYRLPENGKFLFWSLLLSFFFSSLKTIPSVQLEKKLQFQKIVFVQIVENTLFYLLVIILAIFKFDINSFTLAVFFRSLIGVIVIYYLSFWKITVGINFQSFKKLVSFGLPFQTSSLLALVKDDLLILYLGKVLGFEILGYLGWAKKWAEAPIRIIMDNISRVLFPLFSQLQNNKNKLKNIIEKVIFYQSIIIIPAILGLVLIMPKLVLIIPKYNKWLIALPYLYLFALSALLSSYSTPFINFLNGIGKVAISFKFMIFWTILTWLLTPLLTFYYQGFGFPLTLVILSSSFIFVIKITKKYINFNFIKNVYPFLISSLIMFFILKLIDKNFLINNFIALSIYIVSGIISYLLTLTLIFKINFINELKFLFKFNEK